MSEWKILRVAPESPEVAFTDDEAIDAARSAFYAARREQLALLASPLGGMLFDPRTVNYARLKHLRHASRGQVEHAMKVERLLNDAIEAFEATQ